MTEEENKFLRMTKEVRHRRLKVITNVINKYLYIIKNNIIYKYYSLITNLGFAEHVVRKDDLEVDKVVLPYYSSLTTDYVSFGLKVFKSKLENVDIDYFKTSKKTKWVRNESIVWFKYIICPDIDTLAFRVSTKDLFSSVSYFTDTLIIADNRTKDLFNPQEGSSKYKKYRLDFSPIMQMKYVHTVLGEFFEEIEEETIVNSLFDQFKKEFYDYFNIYMILRGENNEQG